MTKTTVGAYPKASIQKKSKRLYVVFRYEGKIVWLPTPEVNKKDAMVTRRATVKAWVDKERGPGYKLPPTALALDIETYLQEKYPVEKTKHSTRNAHVRELGRMEEYAGVSTLQDLDKEQFDKMATRFQEEHPLEPQGWGNVMKIFRPFFGWCKEKGKILVSPINEETWAPDLSNVESKAQVWEDEEYKAVLEVASDRDKIILQVLRGTGIYPMDFFQLEKSHFKMNKKIDVLVMTKKRAKSKAKRKAMSYVQPVTRKVRGIVEAAIDRMLEHNEKHPDDIQTRIFWDITGNVKPNTFSVGIAHRLNGYWKSLYPREEPKGCLDFRHTFATRNAENGIPFHQLRLWMAHEPNSPTLARIYLHLNITEKYLPMED